MNLGDARRIVGSLSFPTKMPGTSYGLPVRACLTGAKLAKVAGTVCAGCYAMRDKYLWPNPRKSQERRLVGILDPRWVDAMVRILSHWHKVKFRAVPTSGYGKHAGSRHMISPMGFHRWHDSGDLQSVEHMARICEVARQTPNVRHWLPTNELALVNRFLAAGGVIPENLAVRVSSVRVNDPRRRAWPLTSSVATEAPEGAHACPARHQDNECGDCRACWSPDVAHVVYHLH